MKETEKIINEVHKYPLLYDTSHCDYKNNRKKDHVWDEIGRRLGISGENLKKRWKSVKDCYTKHLRSEQTHTGQKAKQLDRYRAWPWANQMSIFKRFLQLTPTDSNVSYLGGTQTTFSENSLLMQEALLESTIGTTKPALIVLSPNMDAPSTARRRSSETDIGFENQTTTDTALTFRSMEPQNSTETTIENDMSAAPIYLNEPCTSRRISECEINSNTRSTSTVRSRTKSKNSTQQHVSANAESSANAVLNYLKNRNATRPNYDDIDLICLGYAKTIKKFSAERQALVKFEMAKLLMEQEVAHIRERSPLSDRFTRDVAEYYRNFANDESNTNE